MRPQICQQQKCCLIDQNYICRRTNAKTPLLILYKLFNMLRHLNPHELFEKLDLHGKYVRAISNIDIEQRNLHADRQRSL